MGNAVSIPTSETDALAIGYTQKQIDDYRARSPVVQLKEGAQSDSMTELDAASMIIARFECAPPVNAPITFTAPHNISLMRDSVSELVRLPIRRFTPIAQINIHSSIMNNYFTGT